MGDDSISKRIWKFGLGKIALMVFVFGIFYLIADPMGWIPQSVYDLVNWVSSNFSLMVFALCFLVACYVAVQIINRNKRREY